MELAVVVLSLSVLISLFFIGFLYSKNLGLQKEMANMKLTVDKVNQAQEELVSVDPGDRAILPDYGLTNTETKENITMILTTTIKNSLELLDNSFSCTK